MHTYQTPGPIDLKVEIGAGRVDLSTTETTTTTVELEAMHGDPGAIDLIDNARVEQSGTKVTVVIPKGKSGFFGRKGQVRVLVTMPRDSNFRVESQSADIEAKGRFGAGLVQTGSGDVEIDLVAQADVKTGSGEVEIDTVLGQLKVKTGSGDISVDSVAGDCDVLAGSGDLVVGSSGGKLKAKTGSGDVTIKSAGSKVDLMAGSGDIVLQRIDHGELVARTGSGDVRIGIANGTAAYLDIQTVTGDVTSSLDGGDAPSGDEQVVSVNVISGSGDVVLQRA